MAGMTVAGLMVRSMNRDVDRLVAELDATAARDPLTGVLNRRGLEERLGIELTRARRTDEPLTVIACDLDGLKQINDEHGHAAGDEALALAADVMAAGLRDVDVLARTGGDEFLVLLPNCEIEAGLRIADALRVQVARRRTIGVVARHREHGRGLRPSPAAGPRGAAAGRRPGPLPVQVAGPQPRVARRPQRAAPGSSSPAEFPSLTFRALAPTGEVRGGRAMYEQVFDPVGDSLGLSFHLRRVAAAHAVRDAGRLQGHRLEGRASCRWSCRWWWRSPSTACRSARR